MALSLLGRWGPEDLRVGATLAAPGAVDVYLPDTTTHAPVFANALGTVTVTNTLPNGVAVRSSGVDVNGNGMFFAAPGDYDLKVDGTTYRITVPVNPADPGLGGPWGAEWSLSPSAVVAGAPLMTGGGAWIGPRDVLVDTLFPHLTTAPAGGPLSFRLVTAGAPNTVTLQGGTSNVTSQAFTSTAPTVTLPTGYNVVGRVTFIARQLQNQATGAPPTGWTSYYDDIGGTNPSGFNTWGAQAVWYRAYQPGDPASVTMPTLSAAPGDSAVQAFTVSGADTAHPIDAGTARVSGFVATGGVMDFGTIVTTAANELLVGIVGQIGNTHGNTTWANITEATDQGGSDYGLSIATIGQSAQGTSADVTATMAAGGNFQGRLFSIRPAGGYTTLGSPIVITAGNLIASPPLTGQSLVIPGNSLVNAIADTVGTTTPASGLALGLWGVYDS